MEGRYDYPTGKLIGIDLPVPSSGKSKMLIQNQPQPRLGGCPRIEAVTRESGFESNSLIKGGEYLLSLTNLIGKMGQNPLFRSRFSILRQPLIKHEYNSLISLKALEHLKYCACLLRDSAPISGRLLLDKRTHSRLRNCFSGAVVELKDKSKSGSYYILAPKHPPVITSRLQYQAIQLQISMFHQARYLTLPLWCHKPNQKE